MAESDLLSQQKILSVSELNRLVGELLTQTFPLMWISGEISNFTRAASGHWYFSLKDNSAQVRCVMFKGRNNYVDFDLREGDHVEVRANIGFYEPRGEFQLNIEFIRKAGLGALFEAFEKLKNKLALEGLFDAASKLDIPAYPRTIGIVTSPDAAALRDVLTTLKRRNPNIGVIIYPTPVQGKGAAELIAKAIGSANERKEVDTLIICRGGGSMEDLWQFNEEVLARAIAACAIPTISGVGHETDFTICDFVADVRAPTPTAAAELASQDLWALQAYVKQIADRLKSRMDISLQAYAQKLDYLSKRLISPAQRLNETRSRLETLHIRLTSKMQSQLKNYQQQLVLLEKNLQHLNLQAVLERGFALVQDSGGQIVRDANNLEDKQLLDVTLAHGKTKVIVSKPFDQNK